MEALEVTVLPGATWLDIKCLNPTFTQPYLDLRGDKFGTIIAKNVCRDTIRRHRLPERG